MYKLYKRGSQIAIFATFMSLSGKFILKIPSFYCFTQGMAIIFIIFITNASFAQAPATKAKDTVINVTDSIKLKGSAGISDTTAKKDSTANNGDNSKRAQLERELGIKISKDALPSIINAKAEDSAKLDMKSNVFYLYRKAKVNYEDLELNAGQVQYDQASSIVSAFPYSLVKDTGENKQTFTQGKEKFTYDSIQYNFKSKRAIVRNVHSQYGEGYVMSEQVKRNPDQSIYGYHSVYTTCALDTPHFGIFAHKIKVIPGKVIVSGPANLTIEGIPTPLILPFGLFPVSQKQKSGFVLPTYTIEQSRGLGLRNGGYYFYMNDHVDLLGQADIYTKGSYLVTGVTDYNYLYKFRGMLRFSYAYNKTGEDFEPGGYVTKDFRLNWTHQSDGKAVPGQSFSASVDLGTNSYYSNNSYDPNQILRNQYQSNVSYSKTWTRSSLTMSALHNQNTANKQQNLSLPSLNFRINQINPFQRATSIGSHWYDKITTSYTLDLLNKSTFYDSTFSLTNLSLKNFQTGARHSIPVSASYTVLKYIQMSFSVNYNEYWLTDKTYYQYNNTDKKIDTNQSNGFYTARDFNTNVSFSTRIYGMKLFKKGKLRGIRHVLTPNAGLSYHPDFGVSPFNYYYQSRLDSTNKYVSLSPFVNSIVGAPPLGKSGAVNFGLGNTLQIKVRSSKDTTTGFKNVSIIDGLNGAVSYNPAVDSFQWSAIRADFRTNVLDKINISSSASFDPYAYDYQNARRLPQTLIDKGQGIARFSNATVALGTNFHAKPASGTNGPTTSQEYTRIARSAGYNDYVDFNVLWSFNFSYSLNATNNYSYFSKKDTIVLTHSLTFGGDLQLTKNWKLTVNSGYNFDEKALTLTQLNLFRDLHCWAMSLQTVPFGPRRSFSFALNVKSTVLQDLKLQRRRDYRDSPN